MGYNTIETPKEWMPDESRVLGISDDMDVLINFNQYNETRGGLIIDHKNQQFALWAGQGMGPDTGHAEKTSMKKIVARANELRRRGYAEGVVSNRFARTSLFNHQTRYDQKKIIELHEGLKTNRSNEPKPHFMKRQGFGGAARDSEKKDSIAAAKGALSMLGDAGIEVSWNRKEFQEVLENSKKLRKMADDIEEVKKLGAALFEKQKENESLKKDVTETVLDDIAEKLDKLKEFIPLKDEYDRQSVLWFRDEEGRNTNFGITKAKTESGEKIWFVEFDYYTNSDKMVLNKIYNFTTKEFDDHTWKNRGAPRYSIEKDVLRFKDDYISVIKENLQNRYDMLEQKNNLLIRSIEDKNKDDEARKNIEDSGSALIEKINETRKSLQYNANFETKNKETNESVVIYPGSFGSGGTGLRKFISEKMDGEKGENLSKSQAAALLALAVDCAESGEHVLENAGGIRELEKNGIRVRLRKDLYNSALGAMEEYAEDAPAEWMLADIEYTEGNSLEENRAANEAVNALLDEFGASPEFREFEMAVDAEARNSKVADTLRKTPPRLMVSMREQGLRDENSSPLLERMCDVLEANGFGMRWDDKSFDYQYRYNGDSYLVSKIYTSDSKELLKTIINEMENYDADEFAKTCWESDVENLESIDEKYFDMSYALETDMQKALPALKELQRETEFGKDLYVDLKTVVRAFRNENFSAIKVCDDYQPGLSARKGAWEMSKGGYGQAWQIYFTDKDGTKSEFCSQIKGFSQPVVITNYQYIKDSGLSPFKALASVRDAVNEGGYAAFPQLDEPTKEQYQKHLDARIYGMVGFTDEWNEEGRLVYSDEKYEDEGLLFEVKDILENSDLPVTKDLAEEIAYNVCDRTNAIVYAWEAGEITESQAGKDTVKVTAKAEDRRYNWDITGYDELSKEDRINVILGASITDALAESGITMTEYGDYDYENVRMEIVNSAMDIWRQNKFNQFKKDVMPEINYSVKKDEIGGCVITDLGTGRDVYLQPGEEAGEMLDKYESGEMPDSILSEYFLDDGKISIENGMENFPAEWLLGKLRESGIRLFPDGDDTLVDFETESGHVCKIDRISFKTKEELVEKFLGIADNFDKERFIKMNIDAVAEWNYAVAENERTDIDSIAEKLEEDMKAIAGGLREKLPKKLSADWLVKNLSEYGLDVDLGESQMNIRIRTDAGEDCFIDSIEFESENELMTKFLDLVENFSKETFMRENGYDGNSKEDDLELEGTAEDVELFLKKTADTMKDMEMPEWKLTPTYLETSLQDKNFSVEREEGNIRIKRGEYFVADIGWKDSDELREKITILASDWDAAKFLEDNRDDSLTGRELEVLEETGAEIGASLREIAFDIVKRKNSAPEKAADRVFTQEKLKANLEHRGLNAELSEGCMKIKYRMENGDVCLVDSLEFKSDAELRVKFMDLAANFDRDVFTENNTAGKDGENETATYERATKEVEYKLKAAAEAMLWTDVAKARFMKSPETPRFMKHIKDFTEDDYERHMNRLYAESDSISEIVAEKSYLVGHEYNGHVLTEEELWEAADTGTLGTVIRRYDPTYFAVGYDEYVNEILIEEDKEYIDEMTQILEDQGLAVTADYEKKSAHIGYIDDDGNDLSVASVGFDDAADLAEKLVAVCDSFDAEEFADDLASGNTKYEDYTVTDDGYKNYLEFCRSVADLGTDAGDVAKIMTDWHGTQLLTKDFLSDHLCRNYIVEAGYDREEYEKKITNDCNKNFDPLMEISDACGFDGEQMATVFREWHSPDLFSKEFMENYFEDVLGLEQSEEEKDRLMEAGNVISDALSDAAEELRSRFLYKSQNFIKNSIVYGVAVGGKILLNPDAFPFLDEKGINENDAMLGDSVKILSETLPHEWTHIWDEYTMRTNPDLWNKWTKIVRNTRAYERIRLSPEYSGEIEECGSEKEKVDYIASELHARAAGKFGKKILERIAREDGKITKESMKRWMYEAGVYVAEELGLIDEIGFSAERVPSVKEIIEDAKKLDASTHDWILVELKNKGDDYRSAVIDLAKNSLHQKTENEILAEAKGIRIGLQAKRAEDAEIVKKMLANPFKDLVGGKQITKLDLVSEYMEKKLREVFTQSEMQKDGVNDAAKQKEERSKTVTLQLRNGRKFRITHDSGESCSFHLLNKRTGEYADLGEPMKIKGDENWRKTVAEKAAEKIIDAGGLDPDILEGFEMRKSSRTETRDPKPITVREFNSFLGTKYYDSAEMVRKTGIESLERAMKTIAQSALLADWQRGTGVPLPALREQNEEKADRIESLARKAAGDIVFGKYTGLTYQTAADRLMEDTKTREGIPGTAYKISPELQKMADRIKAKSVADLKKKAVLATRGFDFKAALEEKKRKQTNISPSRNEQSPER